MSATTYEMRFLAFLLLCCLLNPVFGRPSVESYKEDVEEYEDEEESALEDASHEDENVAVDEKVSNNKEDDEGTHVRQNRNYCFKHGQDRTSVDEHGTKENTNDNFSELNSDGRSESQGDQADSDQDEPEANNGSDNYSEADSQNSQFTQESANLEGKGISREKQARNSAEEEENNDVIYENSDIKQVDSNNFDKNKKNYENAEPVAQSYLYNHYYNRPQSKNRQAEENAHEDNQDDSNRNRRGAGNPTNVGNNQFKDFKNFEDEAEQAIIQRYIKQLNKKEVDELFNTLSDEKKSLLEHIINNRQSGETGEVNQAINLNKREITKKAEAVEDNNLMDGVQSDSNSGSPINLNIGDTLSSNNGVKGVTSALDQNLPRTKADDNNNKRSISPNEESITEKLETTTTATESTTIKSDNKREVNFNDLNNEKFPAIALNTNEAQEETISDLQNESYGGSQDEDLLHLINEDEQLHYDYHNPQKRDLLENDSDLAESMKSLQESFSNSKAYEDMSCDSNANMMPLIRVKRKNKHAVKKRAAAILPELNAAYVPESESTDNNEGDEFYEDSFFERTPNFALSDVKGDKTSNSRQKIVAMDEGNQNIYQRSNSLSNVVAKDIVSIGSDTDKVFTRMEGVDENLMYKGGKRKKRAAENDLTLEPVNRMCFNDTSTPILRESSANNNTRPNYGIVYKDNEAFGELSKSYEEIGRYKRIRRLKAPIH